MSAANVLKTTTLPNERTVTTYHYPAGTMSAGGKPLPDTWQVIVGMRRKHSHGSGILENEHPTSEAAALALHEQYVKEYSK